MPKSGPQLPEGEVAGLRERIERRLPTDAYLSYLSVKEKGIWGVFRHSVESTRI